MGGGRRIPPLTRRPGPKPGQILSALGKLVDKHWIRTCQECGHKQAAKMPNRGKELTDAYRNAVCRKCGSAALDYGHEAD